MEISTIYGTITITEPILIALIQSPTVQRMKKIHQYGVTHYAIDYDYTRYDHSIGVLALLRRFGACLNEQIAGLLHDVSHTAFSHVAEIVFDHSATDHSYQDSIHEWFLEQTEIPAILKQFNMSIEDVFHKSGSHRMLEQDLPNICADRLEYNLMGMLHEKLLTQADIDTILSHLNVENGEWFFNNLEIAQKFAYKQLRLNELSWGNPWYGLGYHLAGRALKRALAVKLISHHQMHFGYDDDIWNLLQTSNDPIIAATMQQLRDVKKFYALAQEGEFAITPKFRGLDPWVKTNNGLERLRAIDSNFAYAFEKTKKKMSSGYWATLKPKSAEPL
ncbi:MAG: HD domain-containing protein [Candidatus Babeliales bacterium]